MRWNYQTGKSFADSRGLVYYECSAKTGENVRDLFVDLMGKVSVSQTVNFSRIEGANIVQAKKEPSKGKLTACCTG